MQSPQLMQGPQGAGLMPVGVVVLQTGQTRQPAGGQVQASPVPLEPVPLEPVPLEPVPLEPVRQVLPSAPLHVVQLPPVPIRLTVSCQQHSRCQQ